MRGALTVKEILKKFYSVHSVYIDIIVKACTAFACFYWIASVFEGKGIFANTFVMLIAALLCSVLPFRFMPIVSGAFIVGHSFSMGIDVFAVCAIILLALTFRFLRFVPDDSPAIIFLPIAMHFGIPALVPICYGLRKRPSAVLAVGSGCIVYYLLSAVTSNKDALLEFGKTEYHGVDQFGK